MLAGAGEIWHTVQKREKERELLFVGHQFSQALDGYYNQTPGRAPRYPMQLADLLKDPRAAATVRHLRRIYPDPITGTAEWGLVKGPAGEIMGVYSLSDEAPIKTGNFALADREFEGKTRYSDWVFMAAAR
jgi:type II secretory pathway pseudopilin PulG